MVNRTHKVSAGVLVFRRVAKRPSERSEPAEGGGGAVAEASRGGKAPCNSEGLLEVFLAHPGGPIFRRRDAGAWTIPKGEIEPGEDPLTAARRELLEETGFSFEGPYFALGTVKQKNGKVVHAFACEGSVDPRELKSNLFRMEWPPRSGRFGEFPELDRAAYFDVTTAREKLNEAQGELVGRLESLLAELGRTG